MYFRSIKIDIKTVLPYLVLFGTIAMTWGMWSERLNAVEKKADVLQKCNKILLSSKKEFFKWMIE